MKISAALYLGSSAVFEDVLNENAKASVTRVFAPYYADS